MRHASSKAFPSRTALCFRNDRNLWKRSKERGREIWRSSLKKPSKGMWTIGSKSWTRFIQLAKKIKCSWR
jgi:hypothetical protein